MGRIVGGLGRGSTVRTTVEAAQMLEVLKYKQFHKVHNPFPLSSRGVSLFLRLEKTTLSIEITPTAPAELEPQSQLRGNNPQLQATTECAEIRNPETLFRPWPPGVLEHRHN